MSGKRKRANLKKAVAEGEALRGVRVRAVTQRCLAWDDSLIRGAERRIADLEAAIEVHLKHAAAADTIIADRTKAGAGPHDDRMWRAVRAAAAQRRFAERKAWKITDERVWIQDLMAHQARAAAAAESVGLPVTGAAPEEGKAFANEVEEKALDAARSYADLYGVEDMISDDGLIHVTAVMHAKGARGTFGYRSMKSGEADEVWPSVYDVIEASLGGSGAPVEAPDYLSRRDPLELAAYHVAQTPGLIHAAAIGTARGIRRPLPICSADELNGVTAKLRSARHVGKIFDADVYNKLLEATTPHLLDEWAKMVEKALNVKK